MTELKGRMVNAGRDYSSGRIQITFEFGEDAAAIYDDLKDSMLKVRITKDLKKRSLNANDYCWALIDKLAVKLKMSKEEIYRELIRDIGGVSDLICITEKAKDEFVKAWISRGIGWQVEELESKLDKCITLRVYYGSSTYDTAQMSRLIEAVIRACEDAGIPTITEEEAEKLIGGWRSRKA